MFISVYTLAQCNDFYENSYISGSLFLDGTFMFQAIVVIVNVKIFISTTTHTIYSVLWQIGSIAIFYVAFYVMNKFPVEWGLTNLTGMFGVMMNFFT